MEKALVAGRKEQKERTRTPANVSPALKTYAVCNQPNSALLLFWAEVNKSKL
jgi:hypothetical protein